MGQKLNPGEVGKPWPAEPKWNEERGYFQQSVQIGESFGPPRRLWGKGPSKTACRKDLQKRIKEWKPRVVSDTDYGNNPTVIELVRAWFNHEKKQPTARRRIQTLAPYYQEIEVAAHPRGKPIKIANSPIAGMKALEVKRRHIRAHLDRLGATPTKQIMHKTILNQAFQMLADDDIRDDFINPVASIKGYNGKDAPKKSRRQKAVNPYFDGEPAPFTEEEMAMYWRLEKKYFAADARRDARFRDYTMLLYETAGRPGEGLAIRLDEDIDFEHGTVSIDGTLVPTKVFAGDVAKIIKEFDLSPEEISVRPDWAELDPDVRVSVMFRQPFPKTQSSLRTIKVSPEALAMLKRRKLAARPGQKFLFLSQFGTMVRHVHAEAIFRKIVASTPLEGATLRTLRATKATRVAEKYLPQGKDYALARAREILGHEVGSRITQEHYVAFAERPVIDFVGVV